MPRTYQTVPPSPPASSPAKLCVALGNDGTAPRACSCRGCTRHGEGLSSVTILPCTAGRQALANAADASQ